MHPIRDPIQLYVHALRAGDVALAHALHRRLIRAALAERVLRALRRRLCL